MNLAKADRNQTSWRCSSVKTSGKAPYKCILIYNEEGNGCFLTSLKHLTPSFPPLQFWFNLELHRTWGPGKQHTALTSCHFSKSAANTLWQSENKEHWSGKLIGSVSVNSHSSLHPKAVCGLCHWERFGVGEWTWFEAVLRACVQNRSTSWARRE